MLSKPGAERGKSPSFVWGCTCGNRAASVPINKRVSRSTCSKGARLDRGGKYPLKAIRGVALSKRYTPNTALSDSFPGLRAVAPRPRAGCRRLVCSRWIDEIGAEYSIPRWIWSSRSQNRQKASGASRFATNSPMTLLHQIASPRWGRVRPVYFHPYPTTSLRLHPTILPLISYSQAYHLSPSYTLTSNIATIF